MRTGFREPRLVIQRPDPVLEEAIGMLFDDFGINAGFVEDLHAQYRQSPQLVDPDWRSYFASLERPSPTNGDHSVNGAAAVSAGTNGVGYHALAKTPPGVAPAHTNGAHAPVAVVRE